MLGHQHTTSTITGTPIWYRLPNGFYWGEAKPGDTLCGACWQRFCAYRRKRARTDDAIIVGLVNQPELNYTTATIISYDTMSARWIVSPAARPNTHLRLKLENLQGPSTDRPRKRRRNNPTHNTNNLDFVDTNVQSHPTPTIPPNASSSTPTPQRALAPTSTRRSRFRLRSDATARPPGQRRTNV